ncbi:hypothetical protein [Neorhizobium galegae]|uniref:hypothetical protein n=1 Tax=Neorhizobium galegae TaxID=399 RepID=UPI001F26622B|nr:hypothetical protein [Neorhizobium galegae]UIK04883.1 hypothetical protein LZK81_19850 [Neorhizobium galegae]
MSEALSIRDVIKVAGGPAAVQAELERRGHDLTRDAIYKWPKTGVPDRYWDALIQLTDLGPKELYRANCAAREQTVLQEAVE